MTSAVPHNAVNARSDQISKGMARLLETHLGPQPEPASYSFRALAAVAGSTQWLTLEKLPSQESEQVAQSQRACSLSGQLLAVDVTPVHIVCLP
jgi:hypothetical protein